MRRRAKILNGYVYSGTLRYYEYTAIPTSEIDDRLVPLTKISTTGSVTDTDSVFFHTSSKIPRYKFSHFCEGKKTKRVLSVDKATCCVINRDVIDAGMKAKGGLTKANYIVLPNNFFDTLQGAKLAPGLQPIANDDLLLVTKAVYNDLKRQLPLPDLNNSNFKIQEFYTRYSGALDSDLGSIIDGAEDLIRVIEFGIKIIDDSTLNRQMAEGQLVVGEENYDEFCSMLAAKDPGTVQTGLELLANSDYTTSKFHIGLLLNSYQNQISPLVNKGVNVKNFFEYFKDVKWQSPRHTFLESLRSSLKQSDRLDENKDKFIRYELLKYANDTLKHAGIKVREIFFKDEKIEEVKI